MRVKMLTLECGPNGTFNAGDEREVPDLHGAQLIAGRHAVDITDREKAALDPVEVANDQIHERAVITSVETRKAGKRK